MQVADFKLPESAEVGQLGVKHLKRFWAKLLARRTGLLNQADYKEEWNIDKTMLHLLGVGLEQTLSYVFREAPSFEAFEKWILEVNNNKLDAEKITAFNTLIERGQVAVDFDDSDELVLTQEDLDFWDKHGYVIIKEAIPLEDCKAAISAIEEFIGVDVNNPETWYTFHPARQGIMVQLFQHDALDKNRSAYKIRRAYEQIWKRKDLVRSTDRVGFNPPETDKWKFPGPDLHWDVSLKQPIPFGTQGILYLSDTQANQGAFTLVPGFQHKIEAWLNSLPQGSNPRVQNIHALGAKPIAANAGDFIIWHQALPHGSSPNTSQLPRIVQYINYEPAMVEERDVWI